MIKLPSKLSNFFGVFFCFFSQRMKIVSDDIYISCEQKLGPASVLPYLMWLDFRARQYNNKSSVYQFLTTDRHEK